MFAEIIGDLISDVVVNGELMMSISDARFGDLLAFKSGELSTNLSSASTDEFDLNQIISASNVHIIDSVDSTPRNSQQLQLHGFQYNPEVNGACGYIALHEAIVILTALHFPASAASVLPLIRSSAAFWISKSRFERALMKNASDDEMSFWHAKEIRGLELHRCFADYLLENFPAIVELNSLRASMSSEDEKTSHIFPLPCLFSVPWLSRREIEAGVATLDELAQFDELVKMLRSSSVSPSFRRSAFGFLIGSGDHWVTVICKFRPQSDNLSLSSNSAINIISYAPVETHVDYNLPSSSSVPIIQVDAPTMLVSESAMNRIQDLDILYVDSNNFPALSGNQTRMWQLAQHFTDDYTPTYLEFLTSKYKTEFSEAELKQRVLDGNPYPCRIYSRGERIHNLFARFLDLRCCLGILDACLAGSASVHEACIEVMSAKMAASNGSDLHEDVSNMRFGLLPLLHGRNHVLPGVHSCLNSEIQRAVEAAIAKDELPGAVVLVGHRDRVIVHRAFGNRALVPKVEAMTLDTIFDVASLTKVISASASLMKLFDQGKFGLDDPIVRYLPEFQNGQSDITIRDLLTHFSGLRADVDIEPEWSGYSTGLALAFQEKCVEPIRSQFLYSDINFILLGELVQRLSGMSLPEFAQSQIFEPLSMFQTGYNPDVSQRSSIAPTELLPAVDNVRPAMLLRGVVHDPSTRFMDGVSGHAGVFSVGVDLAKFAQAILHGGRGVFQPSTIQLFTSPASPADNADVRGLGWDIQTRFSLSRGSIFPPGQSFGHTGFTGTSLWIDPASQTYVIILANSVHPHRRVPLTPLRAEIATIVGKHVASCRPDSLCDCCQQPRWHANFSRDMLLRWKAKLDRIQPNPSNLSILKKAKQLTADCILLL